METLPEEQWARLLSALDSLARLWIERAAPIAIGLAESREEREAVYRLRYEVVVEQGWARPEEFPDGTERDGFDDGAVHVVARAGHELAGSSRVVFPVPGRRLPTEEAFDMLVEPMGGVVNFDRTLVMSPHRTPDHRVLAGVIARSWLEARARGFSMCCGILSPEMIERYRQLGIELTILGPARPHWGEDRFPIRFGL
ncbi:MAG: GNAT family N-acetyltransferase [Actinomycetota bacterium]|nr:GNAT family N-acetyltransferase [Actinomycetota bacterium]